jgi:predicted dehydrogenase
MSKVRIGFVGVGGMGQAAHLQNYVTVDDCEVVAIAEVKSELCEKVAARYGIAKTYTDHVEMLRNEKLDGIVASQPFTRHGTLIPELLTAGVPVFTEKPLAGSIEMGEKILSSLSQSNSWYMVGYHKRSDPAVMYAKNVIDELKASNELGKLTYVRLLMPAGDWVANGFIRNLSSTDANPELQWDPPATDMDKDTYDKYIGFVNYYIHQVNLMRHLMGEKYEVTFADPTGKLMITKSINGICGSLEMSPYQTTIEWEESALVAFEHGYVKIELPAPLASNRPGKVTVYKDPGDGVVPMRYEPSLPWVHAMRQQAMNFIAAIKGEMAPLTTASEAMEDLQVARDYIRLLCGK